jgi:hypothetical protein
MAAVADRITKVSDQVVRVFGVDQLQVDTHKVVTLVTDTNHIHLQDQAGVADIIMATEAQTEDLV